MLPNPVIFTPASCLIGLGSPDPSIKKALPPIWASDCASQNLKTQSSSIKPLPRSHASSGRAYPSPARWSALAVACLLLMLFAACTSDEPSPSNAPIPTAAFSPTPSPTTKPSPLSAIALRLERIFPNLSFTRVTNLVQSPTGPGVWFVTEQSGRVWALQNSPQGAKATLFLDITRNVLRLHNEEGLLGLALDPSYAGNGYLYLYYSAANPWRNVLARFTRSPDYPLEADPASELVILEVEKSFGNHNGGQLAFGPDGYLYVGVGDGGGQGDPYGNGQSRLSFLGKILRLDVEGAGKSPGVSGYRIPTDNPFVALSSARGELWAYGLRNPWRFSFDPATGRLWAGDVGQAQWEEVDVIKKGGNYGWNVREGDHCFSPSQGCDDQGVEPPITEYSHALGCSITGGYVYRGKAIPGLAGAYLYADYCSGALWGLRYDGKRVTEQATLAETGLKVISFAQDRDGELYIVAEDGLYRLIG